MTDATAELYRATLRQQRHGKDERYFDLMSYIVSNAVAGEIMAVDNYS